MRSSRFGRWVARFLLLAALLTGVAVVAAGYDSPDDLSWTADLSWTGAVH